MCNVGVCVVDACGLWFILKKRILTAVIRFSCYTAKRPSSSQKAAFCHCVYKYHRSVVMCLLSSIHLGLLPKSFKTDSLLRFLDHTPLVTHTQNTQTNKTSRTPLNEWSAHHTGCYLQNTQQTPETNILTVRRFRTRHPCNQAPQNCDWDCKAIGFNRIITTDVT